MNIELYKDNIELIKRISSTESSEVKKKQKNKNMKSSRFKEKRKVSEESKESE